MMFMRYSKHKKILATIFGGILLVGVSVFLFSLKHQPAPSAEITQSVTASSTADFNPLYDNHADRQRAQELDISMRDYGLMIFNNRENKDRLIGFVPDAGSGMYYLFNYPANWMGRIHYVEMTNADRTATIWKTQVAGLATNDGGYGFIDLNSDGINEVMITSDGDGNRPSCVVEYHRWEGQTFVRVNFIGTDGKLSPTMDCSFNGNIGFKNKQTIYTASEWKRTTDTRLEPAYWKCDREEVVYTYDGKDFRETLREVVEKDIAEFDNNLACY